MNLGSVAEAALAAGATNVIIAKALKVETIVKKFFFILDFFFRLSQIFWDIRAETLSSARYP